MSHFAEIKVAFDQKQEKELIAALETKFGEGHVEVHPDGGPLHGYQGDNRAKLDSKDPNYAPPCHLIIRRKHVGSMANDVGYRRTEDGKYVAYISQYDSGATYKKADQNKVAQDYAERVAIKQLKAKSYSVKRVVEKDGTIKLVATKYS